MEKFDHFLCALWLFFTLQKQRRLFNKQHCPYGTKQRSEIHIFTAGFYLLDIYKQFPGNSNYTLFIREPPLQELFLCTVINRFAQKFLSQLVPPGVINNQLSLVFAKNRYPNYSSHPLLQFSESGCQAVIYWQSVCPWGKLLKRD